MNLIPLYRDNELASEFEISTFELGRPQGEELFIGELYLYPGFVHSHHYVLGIEFVLCKDGTYRLLPMHNGESNPSRFETNIFSSKGVQKVLNFLANKRSFKDAVESLDRPIQMYEPNKEAIKS